MKVIATDREGGMHELPFQEGDTLMEVLTSEDLGVRAECGGCCACATCHVYVAPQWLDRLLPQSDDEIDMPDLGFAVETNRSEEHTSELQSLMRISYAVFCLQQKHTLQQRTPDQPNRSPT